jgi:hypothetical protein
MHRAKTMWKIVAAFPNDTDMVHEFMTKNNLHFRSLADVPLERVHVNATPTLIFVDNNGRVERSWVGLLSPPEELELFKSLFESGTAFQSKTKNGG